MINAATSALPVFERLSELVRTRGPQRGWLQHYANDFHRHDRAYLEATVAPGAEYIWIVRDSGSHIARIGVHAKENEQIEVALALQELLDIYHIRIRRDLSGELHLIDRQRAVELASRLDWHVERPWDASTRAVRYHHQTVAELSIGNRRWEDHGEYIDVSFTTAGGALDRNELTALRIIARGEAVCATQSLFVRLGQVLLNGAPLVS